MNKKSLIAIIAFLLFVIVIMLLDQRHMRDEAYYELEKELKQMEEEKDALKEKAKLIEDVERELIEIKREFSRIATKNLDLTHVLLSSNTYPAELKDAKVYEGYLQIGLKYPPRVAEELFLRESDIIVYSLTKEVPIYMLNDWDNYIEVDWDYMVNLDVTPMIEVFQNDSGSVYFIREAIPDPYTGFQD